MDATTWISSALRSSVDYIPKNASGPVSAHTPVSGAESRLIPLVLLTNFIGKWKFRVWKPLA